MIYLWMKERRNEGMNEGIILQIVVVVGGSLVAKKNNKMKLIFI
jgi:hypothetical protein